MGQEKFLDSKLHLLVVIALLMSHFQIELSIGFCGELDNRLVSKILLS